MLKKEALIFVLVSLMVLPLASAITTIASDDFESGNLFAWNLSSAGGANNWSVEQTDPQEGASHAQSKPQSTSTPASVMDINISTLNYEDITLRYYRKLIGLDTADTFEVEWFTGVSWIVLESISSRNDGSYFFTEFNLSSTANNNSNLRIKFECTAGAVSEFCRVDNVTITGDAQGGASSFPLLAINSPANATLNTSTPRLNLSVGGANIDSVWISLNGGVTNVTYAHRNGTIDFGYLDLIFADDFGSYQEGSNASPIWTNPAAFGTANVTNKTYKLYNETPIDDALAYITNFSQLNYWASSKVMVPTGSGGGAYFTPRFGDVNNKYEIALDYDFSSININKAVGGVWSNLAAVWTGDFGVFVSKDQWHKLGLKIKEDNISAYVDDVLMLNVNDSSLTDEGFSLIAFDDVTLHTAYFDDLEIHKELNYGSHTLSVYVNDTNGNVNSSSVTFFVDVDSSPPTFSGFWENPANATEYVQNAVYKFNVTITDNVQVGRGGIEFNGTNYSVTNISNVYNFSISDLGAGTYSYYWWANDTRGNYNVSSLRHYAISKASQTALLSFNETSPVVFGINLNVSCNGELFRDDVNVTAEIGSGVLLGAGSYDYSCKLYGNQNYSYDDNNQTFVVNQTSQTITSLLNGNNANLVITFSQQVNASFSGTNQTAVSIKINGTEANTGQNYTWGAGGWVVNYSALSNQNYSSYTSYLDLTIDRAFSLCSISSNSPVVYPMQINVTGSCDNPESNFILFRDNNDISSENGELVTLGAGSYSYVVNVSVSQNYTNASASATVIVNQGASEVNLTLNSAEGNITIVEGNSILLNGTLINGDAGGTLRLYNDGNLINEGTTEVSNLTQFNSVGAFNMTVIYISSQNYSQSSETYFVDVMEMGNNVSSVVLNSPANNSVVNENFVILNATVFDLDLNNMTVWFYGNDIVLNVFYNASNGTSFVYNWSNLANGNYNWSVIAFDGNENSTREYRVFSVNKSSTAPRAAIVYPSYSSTYRNNASVPLNFSVASSDLDSCWYSLDNGATNLTIANCANLTFDVIGSGKYNLSLFVNESINGLQGKDNLTFYVDVGDPTVHLLSPTHNNYTNNSFVEFVYIPSSNVSLANCSLWGDFNGSYILNETELSITGDAENSFDVNLTDGGYNWAVACSDVEGSYAITGNRTLNVDVVAPNITNVTQPSGAQSSGDLTFEYAVSDSSSTTCTFAITATSSGSVVFNNVNSECQNIVVTFNVVLADGSYNSDFIAQDGAGNSNSEGSSLSVSTGGGTGPSGGGGSSPGITGAFSLPIGKRDVQLVIEPIGDLAVRRGTSGKFSLTVTSRDLGFLNNCKLRFDGSAGELFSSSDANGFSFGEKFVYGFDVIVPENAEVGRYNTNIVIECDEGEKSTNVELAVFVNDFEIEIDDYERINNKLRVDYTLSEFAGVKHDIAVDYLMSDLDNLPRYKGQESVQLNAGQMLKEFVEFELPKDSFGEFNFVINADDGEVEVRDSRRIFLPSAGGRGFLTGLAISDENLRTLSIVGLVLLIALLVLGVFYSLRKFRRKTKRIKFKKSGRHLIEMEM